MDPLTQAEGMVDSAVRAKDEVQGRSDENVTTGGRLDIAVNEAANAMRRVRDLVAEFTTEDIG